MVETITAYATTLVCMSSIDTGITWLDTLITVLIVGLELVLFFIGKHKANKGNLIDTAKDIIEDIKDDGKLNNSNKKEEESTEEKESEDKE